MKKIVLIGNVNNINSGPGYVVNSIESYLRENNCNYDVIDTCHKSFKLLLKVFKLLFCRNTIVNVHSFGYKIPYIVMLISKINRSNSYYLTLHGIMSIENKINGLPYSEKTEKKLIDKFPNIICVSEYEKNVLKKNFKREKNVFVCYNGCNFYNKEYIEKNDKSDVVTLIDAGGFSRRKNALEVLKLINELNKNNIKCKYLVYGPILDQEYYEKCKKYASENEINELLEYKGKVDRKCLIDAYLGSNYCIALSKFDTFNMTVLEAMQTGTPVIVSEDTGISALLKNENAGLVLENVNAKSVIEFLKEKESKEEYKLICKNAYNLGKRYSKKNMIQEYLKVFETQD